LARRTGCNCELDAERVGHRFSRMSHVALGPDMHDVFMLGRRATAALSVIETRTQQQASYEVGSGVRR